MNRSPNQPTLREFGRPVVAHRLLLASVIVLAVIASVVYSAVKNPTYTSQASVAYQGENQDLGLVGLVVPPVQTADQLASAGAQTIIQPSVARQVQRQLHSRLSIGALTSSVTATVQPTSNLVVIQANASSANEAQRLANAFAAAGAAATNDQLRRGYGAAYKGALSAARRNAAATPTLSAIYSEQLSRLQVLSKIATGAQVVKPASLPGAPSSPRPVRNALLAGVLGIVLGLLAVYVRDALDRRLRSVSDIEDAFALPMLGHVRTQALGRSPRQNGDRAVEPADWELFRILRRNFDFLDYGQELRSVAVTSSLPEEGKSTVAAFLAFTSAAAGKRTLLIECDLRRPVLAERLGLERAPGLTDYLLGDAKPEQVLQVVKFGDPISLNGRHASTPSQANGGAAPSAEPVPHEYSHQLVCITAGTPTQHPVEVLHSAGLARMLDSVRNLYDVIVLDTPPLLSVVDTLEILPHVDAAIVCVRVFSTTRQQAGAGKAALGRLPERPTGIVVTGTRRDSAVEYGYYGYYSAH